MALSCIRHQKLIFCSHRLCEYSFLLEFKHKKKKFLKIYILFYVLNFQELSGLGNRKLINSQAVDDRYKNISEVARTRSIISVGLSCFNLDKSLVSEENTFISCRVQTFNLMALCSEDYIVEPSALQFLVNHGFDFQKQYSQGIPYYRGLDKPSTVKYSIKYSISIIRKIS